MSNASAPDVDRVLRRLGRETFSYRSFPRALEDFAPPPEPLPPEPPVVETLAKLMPGDRAPVSSAPPAPPQAPAPTIAASAIASAPPPAFASLHTASLHAAGPHTTSPHTATLRAAAPPILTVAIAGLPARLPFAETVTPLAAVFHVLAAPARPRANHVMDVRDPPFPFRRR